MIIGSISEDKNIEKRIAITPDILKKYKSIGVDVFINKGYADHIGYNDSDFEKEGAQILNNKDDVILKSNILLQMNMPEEDKLHLFKEI